MENTLLSEILRTTPAFLKKLKDAEIRTLADIAYNFPRTYKDLSVYTKISELTPNTEATLIGHLASLTSIRTRNGRPMYKGVFVDDSGKIEVVWFNHPHLRALLKIGEKIALTGKPQHTFGKFSITGPSFEKIGSSQIHSGRIIPIYKEKNGISSKWFRTKIYDLLNYFSKFQETLALDILNSQNFFSLGESLKQIHFPNSFSDLEMAKKRLAFEEIFNLQLQALRNKWEWKRAAEKRGMKINVEKDHLAELLSNLSFKLTDAQKKVTIEILNDLKKPYPMMRLLEGDVGSGKTIVAALAAFNTIKNGYQTALMAPTEVLANQHFKNLLKLLSPLGVSVNFLAGSLSAKEKEKVIMSLKTGSIDLVVGTHALIQEKVDFANLGLAIIDEQHRFGVKQRDILANYGTPHILSMTATPIPRTLAMTIYGDQDLSVIDELPPGRKEIITRIVPEQKRGDAYAWIESEIKKGRQAYVICPLIQDSEAVQTSSAKAEFERLKNVFKNINIGLLHGKMKQKDKDLIMSNFYNQEISILVSTTVIEVGIDVPNANIILIEGAERFGLAQLHQLRGRVGRGEHQSYCFLFASKPTENENPKSAVVNNRRLKAMVEHSSGFKLAEIDLNLRGPGEVYGVRQSGIPDLKIATLQDEEIILLARGIAEEIVNSEYQ